MSTLTVYFPPTLGESMRSHEPSRESKLVCAGVSQILHRPFIIKISVNRIDSGA